MLSSQLRVKNLHSYLKNLSRTNNQITLRHFSSNREDEVTTLDRLLRFKPALIHK